MHEMLRASRRATLVVIASVSVVAALVLGSYLIAWGSLGRAQTALLVVLACLMVLPGVTLIALACDRRVARRDEGRRDPTPRVPVRHDAGRSGGGRGRSGKSGEAGKLRLRQ